MAMPRLPTVIDPTQSYGRVNTQAYIRYNHKKIFLILKKRVIYTVLPLNYIIIILMIIISSLELQVTHAC